MATEVRLNLGCGLDVAPGWVNLDRSPSLTLSRHPHLRATLHRVGLLTDDHLQDWPTSVVRHDVRRGLPHPDASVTAIYSSHMLEHLYLDDARQVLRECRRVLRPGGTLRLALPDADAIAAELAAARGVDGAGRRFLSQLNAYPERPPSWRQRVTALFAGAPHRWQPTRDLVRGLLDDAGFVEIAEQPFRTGDLPDLDLVEERDGSIFIEGQAPRAS